MRRTGRVVLVTAAAVATLALTLTLVAGRQAGADRAPAPVRVVAVGDIACRESERVSAEACRQQQTSDLAMSLAPDAVLALGDLQYDEGQASGFDQVYGPTWGRLRDITHPVPGNHEYGSEGAAPYFAYFGTAAGERGQGWYSIDLGGWHLVALNSNCDEVGGCDIDSDQGRWLRRDLDAGHQCVLAFWHHPRWSRSTHGDDPEVQPLLEQLYDAGADVVLTGHDHAYQRFDPRRPDGEADRARGIRQFVVGTGGRSLYPIEGDEVGRDGLAAGTGATFGVLELTLRRGGYDWRFVAESGQSFVDSGSAACH